MKTLTRILLTRRGREESAQAMVEYALLLALIAVAAVGAIGPFGNEIADIFNVMVNELSNLT